MPIHMHMRMSIHMSAAAEFQLHHEPQPSLAPGLEEVCTHMPHMHVRGHMPAHMFDAYTPIHPYLHKFLHARLFVHVATHMASVTYHRSSRCRLR